MKEFILILVRFYLLPYINEKGYPHSLEDHLLSLTLVRVGSPYASEHSPFLERVVRGIIIHLMILPFLEMGKRGTFSYFRIPLSPQRKRGVILPLFPLKATVKCSLHMTLLSFP